MTRRQFSLRTLVLVVTLMPILIWAFYGLYVTRLLGRAFGVAASVVVVELLIFSAPSLTASVRSRIASIIAIRKRKAPPRRGEFTRLISQQPIDAHEQPQRRR